MSNAHSHPPEPVDPNALAGSTFSAPIASDENRLDDGGELRLLQAHELRFYSGDGGYLALDLADGASYPQIGLIRLFPIRYPDMYLSVRELSGDEIGIIEDLATLDAETRALLNRELDMHRYLPVVRDITYLRVDRDEMTWEVRTDHGDHAFNSKRRSAIRHLRDGRLLVTDTEGCRYLVPPMETLPRKTRILLEGVV